MRMTNNLSSLSLKLTHNFAIVGETGVGKSSITNLVVSTDSAVTVGTSYHDWNLLETQTFRLWDTPGLDVDPSGIEIARTSIAQGQEGSAFLVETY